LTTTYVRADRVLWRRTTDRVVILASPLDELISMTGTGRDLWDCLAVPRTVADIASELAARYDVAPDRVLADIAPVLEELVGRGVIDATDS
jgi:hypothetical protein